MIFLIQHFEADFLCKVSLKILNSGIILKAFTHAYMRFTYVLHHQAMEAQLLTYTKYGCRRGLRPKIRPLAQLELLAWTLFRRICTYSKTCVKRPLPKRPKISFQDQQSLNADQKYCRMLQWEHFAVLLTFIKLPFVIKIFVLSIFEWPFFTGFTV